MLTDYANLTMQFQWCSHSINLQGIRDNDIQDASSKQLKGLQATKYILLLSLSFICCYTTDITNLSS